MVLKSACLANIDVTNQRSPTGAKAIENPAIEIRNAPVCLVKTWSSRLVARWSRTDVGDLAPESSGDPWSPLERVTQHVRWDAAMVVEHECEQLRCRVEWHA